MEALAKSVQQAQAAVLGVQDDLALLRAQLEEDSGTLPVEDSACPATNPYYVELQASIQQKQEAAAQLLQSSAHLFYEQFGAVEEKAARLENVRQKEKELQSAKKSMQRYFDAHAKELAEVQEAHESAMRLELEKRQHLEDGAAAQWECQRAQHVAHHVLQTWMKKAMIRNLTREYMARQSTTRQTYQNVACAALAQQREIVTQQHAFYAWRARLHTRQLRRVEAAAAESERRAQFFRQELATTQQALQERLGAALEQRQDTNAQVSSTAKGAMHSTSSSSQRPRTTASAAQVQHEDEVQRLRAALEEMTLEFSERTGTYIRQQEHLEQLFWTKEQKLHETILTLQRSLTEEQRAHATYVAQQRTFVEHLQHHYEGQQQAWAAAMQRKEEFAHYTMLGLVGRLRHRQRGLQDEVAQLTQEVRSLAPLSERCVQLENEAALAQQQLQKTKERTRMAEQRTRTDHLVSELLTDRVARAESRTLRARYFAQWMQHSSARALQKAQTETYELKVALQQQRQQLLRQQQESAARHQAEVDTLRDNAEQLRRGNVRLQTELDAALRAQHEREAACHDGALQNSDLSAALLREKMERRGLHDKWWCSRAENVVLAEAQGRCRLEAQEAQWWTALRLRESGALKVWTAALHYDAAQLTAVCEGWEAHCRNLEATQTEKRRAAAVQLAGALERGQLQAQTRVRWAAWQAWAMERRAVRAAEAVAADTRKELVERHGHELARLHARHDAALRRQQQELTVEKTQLQGIHQDRSEAQRRLHAQEQAQLAELHRRHLAELHASHAERTAEQEDALRELHDQLERVGAVVVEYCAAATFAQWRAWAMERRVRRNARQRGGFLLRVQAWHDGTTQTQEDALVAKQRVFAEAVAEVTKAHHRSLRAQTQRRAQEDEVAAKRERGLIAAQEAAESEAAHLRAEMQHTRGLYDAERHDHEALHGVLTAERRDHRTALSLAARLQDWQAVSERIYSEHHRAMCRVFEEAVAEVLCDAHIDTQALRETYVDCVKEHEATRKLLKKTTNEHMHLNEMHATLVKRHEKLERTYADTAKELGKLTATLTALVKEHEDVREELESVSEDKQAAKNAHAALEKRYEKLEKDYAESAKEVELLTDTLSALVKEHEAVQSEREKATAEKERADGARAALASEYAAIQDELTTLKAQAREVQSAFDAYMAAHEKERADAEVQTTETTTTLSTCVQTDPVLALRTVATTPTADDSLEVSPLNAQDKGENQHQTPQQQAPKDEEQLQVQLLAPLAAKNAVQSVAEPNNSVTASVVEPPLQVVPADFAQRLRELESYLSRSATDTDAATEDHLDKLLRQPFSLQDVPFDSSFPEVSAASLSIDAVNPSEVVAVVCHMLETLRQAAVRWAETQARRYSAAVATIDTQRAQSEEALHVLRENMAELLEEQRGLAEEIQEDLQHLPDDKPETEEFTTVSTAGAADSPSRSLLLSQTVQERLTALTSRYARVLDAFYSDITRRQDTFYSVNGMLVEVDQFSEALLERFADNVHEMARLREAQQPKQCALSSAGAAPPLPGTPVSRCISDDLSMMSPEPRHPQQANTSQLARVLGEIVSAQPQALPTQLPQPPQSDLPSIPAQRAKSSTSPPSSSSSKSSSSSQPPAVVSPSTSSSAKASAGSAASSSSSSAARAPSTAEKQALRERVHLLEKMLVEAKVQLAEARTLMDSARRAASLAAPPSAEAQGWASQAAREFADLAVGEGEWVTLYSAAEAATARLAEALRSCRMRLKETQQEMSQQLQTACLSVEASLQQRHRVEAERYEAAVRSCNEALADASRQHAREMQRGEQQREQLRTELAALVEKQTREVQLMRQSYTNEIGELTDHLSLLEEELQRTRQGTQAAVRDAVARQTELLTAEHEQRLRSLEKRLTRLTAEKSLVEERLAASEDDAAQRLQQERDAVARLQQRLTDMTDTQVDSDAAPAEISSNAAAAAGEQETAKEVMALHTHASDWMRHAAELYESCGADKSVWFASCVAELLEQEREEWETEVMHLRERVAALLDKPPSPAASAQRAASDADASFHKAHPSDPNASSQSPSKQTVLADTVEDTSSQALTLSPSPQRTHTQRARASLHEQQTPLSPRHHTPLQQRSPRPSAATAAEVRDTRGVLTRHEAQRDASIGTSPTRCRSPSLDSLELSQSLLRYSKLLSDQRSRNAERLERASALTAEVDDLLLRGAELARLADKQEHR